MATNPGMLYKFPWEDMGNFKYLLFVPFAASALTGNDDADNWAAHIFIISMLRYVTAQIFTSISRIHNITERTKIQDKGISFEQIDREDNWDDFIILQAYIMTAVHNLPYLGFGGFPLFNKEGLWKMLWFHVGAAELVYYWLHRALHHKFLYARYHSHHHASFVPEPITGSVHPFMEHLMYTAVFAIPLLGTFFTGGASVFMFYLYLLGFDIMNSIGHCNFEFFPRWFMSIPGMKYLIYTPTFHSLHHSRVHANFCLFMPIYDHMFGTVHKTSDSLYEKAISGQAVPKSTPDVVFVGHGTNLVSLFHLPFMFRSFSSRPFEPNWWLAPLWPFCVMVMFIMRAFGKVFVSDKHRLRHLKMETWVTPAWAIQFFFKSQWNFINSKIEEAILEANDAGVKVIGLGALNKNEALNGGGKLFVDKHPTLKTRVVHGNTLTAAAVLKKIPSDVKEVFVTGATSKLGRAISLYLAERGVKVIMMTQSAERFQNILDEAPPKAQKLIVHATKVEAGANCKDWIIGKFCNQKDQSIAPAGSTFHQFVVPPLQEFRSDCVYTDLPAFAMPGDAKYFKTCEMTMERGCVHACHAGAVIHALEGWDFHEVGAIDHTRIDETWDAAMKHGMILK
jgi:sterol desaturase/sphingolipid hydroxylase (fatty acid hydroxylase superfamily)